MNWFLSWWEKVGHRPGRHTIVWVPARLSGFTYSNLDMEI